MFCISIMRYYSTKVIKVVIVHDKYTLHIRTKKLLDSNIVMNLIKTKHENKSIFTASDLNIFKYTLLQQALSTVTTIYTSVIYAIETCICMCLNMASILIMTLAVSITLENILYDYFPVARQLVSARVP